MGLLILAGLVTVEADEVTPSGKSRLLPGIVGQDDRVPLDSTAWPWHSLGRLTINREKGEYCSGALIAPDVVLTAGHCLYNRVLKDWHRPEAILFVAGLNRDNFKATVRGLAIEHDDSHYDKSMPTLNQIAHDWALLRLEHPLPLKPLPLRPLPPGIDPGHLLRAGYSVDRPFLLSLHDGCRLLDRLAEDRILFTNCDSTYGDSGSPLLRREKNDYWIVGVSSAVVKRGQHPGAYAVHVKTFLQRLNRQGGDVATPAARKIEDATPRAGRNR